jgi:hypothetical protein
LHAIADIYRRIHTDLTEVQSAELRGSAGKNEEEKRGYKHGLKKETGISRTYNEE